MALCQLLYLYNGLVPHQYGSPFLVIAAQAAFREAGSVLLGARVRCLRMQSRSAVVVSMRVLPFQVFLLLHLLRLIKQIVHGILLLGVAAAHKLQELTVVRILAFLALVNDRQRLRVGILMV